MSDTTGFYTSNSSGNASSETSRIERHEKTMLHKFLNNNQTLKMISLVESFIYSDRQRIPEES